MKSRRGAGYTLVELVVAMAVSLVFMAFAYELFFHFSSSRGGAMAGVDRRATRALLHSRVMDRLLADVRSSVSVEEVGTESWVIIRYQRDADGNLQLSPVTWEKETDTRLVRTENQDQQVFDFAGLLEEDDPVLDLKLEPVQDVLFIP